MKIMRSLFFQWAVLIGWVVIISLLSLLPAGNLTNMMLPFKQFDKVVHFIFYFGFALLIFRLLFNMAKTDFLTMAVISAVVPIVYSGIIEIIQEYLIVSRGAELADFLVNILGAISAVYLYRLMIKVEFDNFYTKELS